MMSIKDRPNGLGKKQHIRFIIFHAITYSGLAFMSKYLSEEAYINHSIYACLIFGLIGALLTGIIPLIKIYYYEYKSKMRERIKRRDKHKKIRNILNRK